MSSSNPFQQTAPGIQTNQAFRRSNPLGSPAAGLDSNRPVASVAQPASATAPAPMTGATQAAMSRPVPVTQGVPAASGAGGVPSRLEQISVQLAAAGFPNHAATDEADTLLLIVEGEPRFRLVAPADSYTLLLIADVFKGGEQEIGMMAPSLLHANFTCQRMSVDNLLTEHLGADAQPAEPQALPVMGLDLERMTVVLTLQIHSKRLEEEGFTDFMVGLVETISEDTEMLVSQFRAVTASALP